eukprot:scaffold12008_cov21-Tisochrysis_lutea.AAC.4
MACACRSCWTAQSSARRMSSSQCLTWVSPAGTDARTYFLCSKRTRSLIATLGQRSRQRLLSTAQQEDAQPVLTVTPLACIIDL